MDVNEEWDAVLSQNKEEEILKLTVSFPSFHFICIQGFKPWRRRPLGP